MTQLTTKNYFSELSKIDRNSLPKTLKDVADFVDEVTENGKSWDDYNDSENTQIKRTIDQYFIQLASYLNSISSHKPTQPNVIVHNKTSNTQSKPPLKKAESLRKSKITPFRVFKNNGEKVERISEELRLIKRYVLMHGKIKNGSQIRSFINSLQRAMIEKRIRKTSKYSKEILEIQDNLLILFGKSKGLESFKVEIEETKRTHLLNIIGKQELMLSVRFIKSYIGLQGKMISNVRATSLHNRLAKAINIGLITQKDPYWNELQGLLTNLKSFVKKNSSEGILVVPTKELNGLEGIVSGFEGLNGFNSIPDHLVVDSLDIVNMEFDKLDFTGKWKEFIGNPSKGFTSMVFGKPKFGKSTLCIDFAGYLARNHGKVLYIAREERIGDTIKEKLQDTNVAHPNLQFVGSIPNNLSQWDFVFLDSVTKLGLTPDDLENLQATNPQISFVYIFQTTKQGNFRGENGYQHDVDVVIEVPEKGKAVQFGRFNQGGEMDIFN
ncbi:MAG: hypothetical protein HYR91_04130 [Flavobacteriia bacterium]|nr:hypothetical protein [Flavobacteriia bacterium]